MATIQLPGFVLGLPIWYLPTPGVAPTMGASSSSTVETGPSPPLDKDPKGKGKKENKKKPARSEQPASNQKAGGKKTASRKAATPLPTADQVGSTPSVDDKTADKEVLCLGGYHTKFEFLSAL